MDSGYGEWGRKGATLSDKTAREEFGLSREDIVEAINAGRLQYRVGSMHGNPWLRLLRSEVEELVRSRDGEQGLQERKAAAELAQVEREMKRLQRELAALEERRSQLVAAFAG